MVRIGGNCGSWMFVCAAAAATIVAGCAKKSGQVSESIADIQKRQGVPVTQVTVERRSLVATERQGGTIEGYNQAVLSAGIPATISAVNARVGGRVEKDAVVVKLVPMYQSAYDLAKAGYDNTEKSMNRVKTLAQEGGVSQDMLDQVQTGYEAARLNLEGARRLENLIAPFSGTVVELYERVNAVVGPGTNLVKIATLDRVRVKLTVSEAIIGRFSAGQKAFAYTQTDTSKGVVEKVSMAADEGSHTFTVEAVFGNGARRFRPGMYVTVDIVTREIPGALALPMEAVVSDGEQKSVFVIDAGVAKKTPVTVGIRGGNEYEITSGVTEGAHVALAGARSLTDGVKVNIVR